MKRKLIGIVKVYMAVKNGVETYETVWPRKLYNAVHGTSLVIDRSAQHKTRTVSTWAKRSAPCVMTKWGRR